MLVDEATKEQSKTLSEDSESDGRAAIERHLQLKNEIYSQPIKQPAERRESIKQRTDPSTDKGVEHMEMQNRVEQEVTTASAPILKKERRKRVAKKAKNEKDTPLLLG